MSLSRETVQSWKARIARANLSQEKFCTLSNISITSLSAFLNDKRFPSKSSYNKIESALKMAEEIE